MEEFVRGESSHSSIEVIFIFVIAKYIDQCVTFYEFECQQEAIEFYNKIDDTKIFTTIVDPPALSLKNQTQAIVEETTKVVALR